MSFLNNFVAGNSILDDIKVSLFGVATIDDLNKRLFLALHPKLDTKHSELLFRFVVGDSSLVNMDKLLKEFTPKNFLNSLKKVKKNQKRVIVFDDFERCQLTKKESLGFINGLLEKQWIKCLIIGAQNVIEEDETNNEDDEQGFSRIKEKVIGKTLKVSPNVEDVFISIVSEYTGKYEKFILSQ